MRCLQCQCRIVARRVALRQYSQASPRFIPQHTDYYGLDLSEPGMDAFFGPPRVERTKLEAAARKIAERLLVHDETNRALLEEELEQDGAKYLKEYVDLRDAQPPAAYMSSSRVSDRLYKLLGPPVQAQGRESKLLLGQVAQFMATHQVVKLSDYHRMIRWLLNAKLVDAAVDVMETLLMSRQTGFSTSTYRLCLELSLIKNDAQRFGELAKRVKWKRNQWRAFQHKFDAPDFNGKDPAAILLLASGYLRFNRKQDLTYIMEHTPTVTMNLLLINMWAAAKWHDVERAQWTLAKIKELAGTEQIKVDDNNFWSAAAGIEEIRGEVQDLKQQLLKADSGYEDVLKKEEMLRE